MHYMLFAIQIANIHVAVFLRARGNSREVDSLHAPPQFNRIESIYFIILFFSIMEVSKSDPARESRAFVCSFSLLCIDLLNSSNFLYMHACMGNEEGARERGSEVARRSFPNPIRREGGRFSDFFFKSCSKKGKEKNLGVVQ